MIADTMFITIPKKKRTVIIGLLSGFTPVLFEMSLLFCIVLIV